MTGSATRRFACAVVALAALGRATASLPPGRFAVIEDFVASATLQAPSPEHATLTRFVSDGIPALRVNVVANSSNQYGMELRSLNDVSVSGSDVLLASMEMRVVPGTGEPRWRMQSTSFQQLAAPFAGNLDAQLNLTTEWLPFSLPFGARVGGAPGTLRWRMALGLSAPLTLEVRAGNVSGWHSGANVTSTALPVCCNFDYEGREPGAAWRNASMAAAENVRRGTLLVTALDSATGRRAAGALVRVDQIRHAFRHGTAVDVSVLAEAAAGKPLSPDDARYIEVLRSGLFQTAVFEGGTKWPAWIIPASQNKTLAAYAWLKQQGYYVRMHNLVWPSCGTGHLPAFLCAMIANGTAPSLIEAAVEAHIRDEAGREVFQGGPGPGIDDVDVCNEPYDNHELQDLDGTNATIARWINVTAEALPDATLRVNDAHLCSGTPGASDHLEYDTALFKDILGRFGGRMSGIGCESHIRWQGVPPARYLARLEALAALGTNLTVRITEHDMGNPDTELAGDMLRDLLILCFGSRSCDGMLTWGFWTGRSWIDNGPFFELDWSPKPALAHYKSLLFGTWWTAGATGSTGAQGQAASVGVWQGLHNVTVTLQDGRTGSNTAWLPQFHTGSVDVVVSV